MAIVTSCFMLTVIQFMLYTMFILHHSVTVASESGIYYVHGGSHTHMCLVQEADGVIIRMDGASMERHSHVIGSKKEVDKKTCAQECCNNWKCSATVWFPTDMDRESETNCYLMSCQHSTCHGEQAPRHGSSFQELPATLVVTHPGKESPKLVRSNTETPQQTQNTEQTESDETSATEEVVAPELPDEIREEQEPVLNPPETDKTSETTSSTASKTTTKTTSTATTTSNTTQFKTTQEKDYTSADSQSNLDYYPPKNNLKDQLKNSNDKDATPDFFPEFPTDESETLLENYATEPYTVVPLEETDASYLDSLNVPYDHNNTEEKEVEQFHITAFIVLCLGIAITAAVISFGFRFFGYQCDREGYKLLPFHDRLLGRSLSETKLMEDTEK